MREIPVRIRCQTGSRDSRQVRQIENNADKFTVHVQGGVATIEGKTDVMQHKGTATRMAKTGGALAVNNHVQISDAARGESRRQPGEGAQACPDKARRRAFRCRYAKSKLPVLAW